MRRSSSETINSVLCLKLNAISVEDLSEIQSTAGQSFSKLFKGLIEDGGILHRDLPKLLTEITTQIEKSPENQLSCSCSFCRLWTKIEFCNLSGNGKKEDYKKILALDGEGQITEQNLVQTLRSYCSALEIIVEEDELEEFKSEMITKKYLKGYFQLKKNQKQKERLLQQKQKQEYIPESIYSVQKNKSTNGFVNFSMNIPLPEQTGNPNLQSMWGCMLAADRAAKQLRDKVICIVGNSRIGKSTLHNFINKVPMVGQNNWERDVIYKKLNPKMGVQIGDQFESITLIPNISNIYVKRNKGKEEQEQIQDKKEELEEQQKKEKQENKEEVSLVDMPGYNDENRSHVGLFAVNYMLESMFRDSKQTKFILTISSPVLLLTQISQVIKPFEEFLEIFNIKNMKQNNDNLKFYKSIKLVILKSTHEKSFYKGKIKRVIKYLQQNKKEKSQIQINIKQFLKSLVNQNGQISRISLFKQASLGMEYQYEDILLFNDQDSDWDYYRLDNKMINHPFSQKLEKLKKKNRQSYDMYKNDIQQKYKCISKCFDIVLNLMDKTFSTEIEENSMQNNINYEYQFKQIYDLQENNPYGSLQLIYQQMKCNLIQISRPKNKSILEIIQPIKEISLIVSQLYKACEQEIYNSINKVKKMEEYVCRILQICKRIFCATVEQQKAFVIFQFIVKRSLYECETLCKMDNQTGSQIVFMIQNFSLKLLPKNFEVLFAKILINARPKDHEKYCYDEYLEMFTATDTEEQSFSNINKIQQSNLRRQLLYCIVSRYRQKAKQANKNPNPKPYQALNYLLTANKYFGKYIQQIGQFIYHQTQKAKIDFKQNQIYKMIAAQLQKMSQFEQIVERLYNEMKRYHMLEKFFEKRIAQCTNNNKKYNLMQKYAQFLAEDKKYERLLFLYQEMLDIFECFPEKRRQIKKKLEQLPMDRRSNYTPKKDYEGYERIDIEKILKEVYQKLNNRDAEKSQASIEIQQNDQNISSEEDFEKRQLPADPSSQKEENEEQFYP